MIRKYLTAKLEMKQCGIVKINLSIVLGDLFVSSIIYKNSDIVTAVSISCKTLGGVLSRANRCTVYVLI